MTLDYIEFAQVRITEHENPLGGMPVCSFEWIGSPHAPIEVKDWFIPLLKEQNFTFKLELLYREPWRDLTVYRRTDVPINLRLIQFLEYRWLKHCKAFDGFQMRLIMTLHVWGLAYVSEHERPSWECVGRKR